VEECFSVSYTLPEIHEVRPRDEVRTIVVEGEIDPGEVIALQRRISVALDAGYRRILIDLSAVTLMLGDQTASMFCGVVRRLTSSAGPLGIVACPPQVERALELFEIDRIELYPDHDLAVSALTQVRPK
jgi:anti-anti-sigma regulatory factor